MKITKHKGLADRFAARMGPARVVLLKGAVYLKGLARINSGKRSRLIFAALAVILIAGLWFLTTFGDVGRVNGHSVSKTEFYAYLKYKRIPEDQKERVAAELDRYLEREALADLAEDEGVLDAQQIQTEVNEFRKQMLISRYFEEFLKQKVTEEAVRNFYATNQARYQARKVHVAHVLLRTNPKMSEAEKQALLTKAQEVYSHAMAGEDFAKLVQAYSEDTLSAKRGGDLGWLEEGAIDPTFSTTVFKMTQGQISKPFPTPFGFHVVKVLDNPQVIQQPFERVQGDIRYELRQRTKEEEMRRLLDDVSIKNYLK